MNNPDQTEGRKQKMSRSKRNPKQGESNRRKSARAGQRNHHHGSQHGGIVKIRPVALAESKGPVKEEHSRFSAVQ